MGINKAAVGISKPGFAIELARGRVHPAWLSRTVTLGEMFKPDDAALAGFLDRVVPVEEIEAATEAILAGLKTLHAPSHALAKHRLRRASMAAMRPVIDAELTLEAYTSRSTAKSAVVPQGGNG